MQRLLIGRAVGWLTLFFGLSGLLMACGQSGSDTPGPAIIFTTTNAVTTPSTGANPTTAPASTTAPSVSTAAASAGVKPVDTGKIVYDTADNQIFVANPDGSRPTKIASGHSPLFSPDGKRVAFVVTEGQALGNPPLKSTISSVNLDGTGQQDYCPVKTNLVISLVSWSPRGKFIAFRGVPANTDALSQIYLCTIASRTAASEGIKVTQGDVLLAYDWTPDGGNALWQSGKDNFNIYYGDPDKAGKDATNVSNGLNRASILGDRKLYEQANFAPDGKTIAIVGSKLFFVSVPASKSPFDGKIIDGLSNPIYLAWSPDSQSVLVVDSEANSRSLKLVELATGKVSKMVDKVGGGVDWIGPKA